MGSKSKLDLILIRLIEEPNPKVEGDFDLGKGAGGGGGGPKISRGLAALVQRKFFPNFFSFLLFCS